jgi:hypothetical protein
MEIKINTIQDLINLGNSEQLTPEQFAKVVHNIRPFLGIFLKDYTDTKTMATIIEQRYKEQWEGIFLDY